jgi:DNA modification methylase
MRSIILIGLLQGSWGGKVGANVWNIPICSGKERVRESNGQRLHSTQKPLKLLQNIMKVSTRPGDLLLDPMAGTGTSCVAAAMLGRHFLGIEREKRYAEAALKRIDALKNSKVLYG